MKKIYTKKQVHPAMHIIQCPECKKILASASERMLLPEWSICDDCNGSTLIDKVKKTLFDILKEKRDVNGIVGMIEQRIQFSWDTEVTVYENWTNKEVKPYDYPNSYLKYWLNRENWYSDEYRVLLEKVKKGGGM